MQPGLADRIEQTLRGATVGAQTSQQAALRQLKEYGAEGERRVAAGLEQCRADLGELASELDHRAQKSVRGIQALCSRLDATAEFLRASAGR
jgi:hypothetical protein